GGAWPGGGTYTSAPSDPGRMRRATMPRQTPPGKSSADGTPYRKSYGNRFSTDTAPGPTGGSSASRRPYRERGLDPGARTLRASGRGRGIRGVSGSAAAT